MLRTALCTLIVIAMSAPAWAAHCPKDIAKIDAALASSPSLPASTKSTVMTLRDTGERLHKSGKHAESVQTLSGALELLEKAGVKVD